MKIALAVKEFSISRGGGERFCVGLSRELVSMGHEVHLFANKWREPEDFSVHFHHVPISPFPAFRRILSFPWNCRKLLAREEFDIVNGLTEIYPQDVYRMGAGSQRYWLRVGYPGTLSRFLKLSHPKTIAALHVERNIFKNGNYHIIVANSELVKRHAMEDYGVPEEAVRVVYNGVDKIIFNPSVKTHREEIRRRHQIDDDEVVILFVSSNMHRKGLSSIMESLARLKNDAPRLRMISVGSDKTLPFVARATAMGISNRMTFAGHVEDVEKYYGAADIFCLPSRYDPFANACLEAMACGLPVITTRTNGSGELVEDGENGFLIDDADQIEQLTDAISHLLSPDERNRMGENAVNTSGPFTPRKNAEQMVGVYEEVLKMKRRG